MKRNIWFILIFLLIILFGYFIFDKKTDANVCFDDVCFNVEIADEEQERNKGLMFREELDQNKGMLFIFEQPGVYSFWMKDTPLPLDIIWMDPKYKVVYIANNTVPYSLDIVNPLVEAKYVLEINGGLSDYLGIKLDSVAELRGIDG